MPKSTKILLIAITALLIVSVILFGPKLRDEVILDNKDHYLTCSQLPSTTEVNQAVEQSEKVIKQIKEVNPGIISVDVDTSKCPGKADILIFYGSHSDRQKIEKIIKGSRLEQLPTRWRNI